MMPIRRDLSFELPSDKMLSWHPAGPHMAHFYNTLSIFFPVGERFFIDAVRHYRDQGMVKDERLLQAVRAFIGQEAMHGREHEAYNAAYTEAGVPADRMEKLVDIILRGVQRIFPRSYQLGGTIALEHFTATLAHVLLDTPEMLDGADAHFEAIWRWHALEETEHKAVAYDVFREVYKDKKLRGCANRVVTMFLATVIFWSLCYPFYIYNVARTGGLFKLKGWWTAARYQFLKPGALRRMLPLYLDYFRPGFHPWDHDNRHFLEGVEALAEQYNRKAA